MEFVYDEHSDTVNTDGTVTVPHCTACGARAGHKAGGLSGHYCTNADCATRKNGRTAVTFRRFAITPDGIVVPANPDCAAMIEAALHNLTLDLNGHDDAALTVVQEYVGRSVSRDEAYDLIDAAEKSLG